MVAVDVCYKLLAIGVLCLSSIALFLTLNRVYICDNIKGNGSASFVARYSKPPPPDNVACMARYIVHQSNWCSLAYISQQHNITGYPASRIYSISDGSLDTTTGDIYFMVSPMDETVTDLAKNNECSVIATLDQEGYCAKQKLDPEDPRCAQAGFTGKFIPLEKNSTEWSVAKTALWSRHPVMKEWWYIVPGHKFFFAKFAIEHIFVVDKFGGRKFPSIVDYYNATDCLRHL